MKERYGFVSNSSSSSFICNLCGDEREGDNLKLGKAGMYVCECGHVIGIEHLFNHLGYRRDGYSDNLQSPESLPLDVIGAHELPSEYCPVCHPEYFTEEELNRHCGYDLDITGRHKINLDGIMESW